MMKIIFSLIVLSAPHPAQAAAQFVPATQIEPKVRVELLQDAAGQAQYIYSIMNGTASQQEIRDIYLLVNSTSDLAISGTQSWDGSLRNDGTAYWGTATGTYLSNGKSLHGLLLSTSRMPSISKFFIRGNAPLPSTGVQVQEDPSGGEPILIYPEDADMQPFFPDIYEDAVQVQTIAPSTFTFTDIFSAIDRLIALKHQSASLGWLLGAEFIRDLDEKLDQAKAASALGKNFKARKKLEQFIHELEERRKEQMARQHEASEKGKDEKAERAEGPKTFLDDNAYYLLKVNAGFIVSKLPAKKHGEDADEKGGDE